jgi:hypothetical protein
VTPQRQAYHALGRVEIGVGGRGGDGLARQPLAQLGVGAPDVSRDGVTAPRFVRLQIAPRRRGIATPEFARLNGAALR